MTGLAVLDVFISLVFLYLLYSLFAMTIIEAITSSFSSRSKNLITGIDRLLADDQQSNGINHSFLNLFWVKTTNPLTKAFYKHPAIKYLGQKGINSKPSYIAKDRFGSTLIDLLRKGAYLDDIHNISATLGIIPEYDSSKLASEIRSLEQELSDTSQSSSSDKNQTDFIKEKLDYLKQELFQRTNKENPWEIEGLSIGTETKYQLKNLWQEAANDKEKFKALIENWYEDQMDRIAGWYKRKLTFLTFIIGFIIAGLFNVDSIGLTTALVKNEEMRAMLVEGAKTYIANNPDGVNTGSFTEQRQYIDSVNTAMSEYNYVLGVSKEAKFTVWTLFGWLITAFAISLGAPFWFDLLNKMMQVRNSVKTPISGPNPSNASTHAVNNTKAIG
ncbi:hypothetical protein SYJ56_02775 [Algoriphagus sp. D3-2-R+10]|uniref:hypothetical protein n=1 Tax=Algoriphagus aurantiacus TaxID=3103948 RepID=UPI002B3C96AA|nr:hypothetical protein [Algoriphagus sp. D3-2-R+10]MEB2774211.1 hypothetical protein [Algoriphagus sp. D3-2-R+10]